MRQKRLLPLVIGSIYLVFLVVGCAAPIETATPTPTPVPLFDANPTLYLEGQSTCQSISDKGVDNYPANIKIGTLKPKSLLTVTINLESQSRGEILFPYLEATSTEDLAFLLCITETGDFAEYTNGTRIWAATWDTVLVDWASHKVIARQSFSFSPPNTLGRGEAFGPSLREQSFRWLATGIQDTTLRAYPGYLVSISPDQKKMVLWLGERQNPELWDLTTGQKLGDFVDDTHPFGISPDWKTFVRPADDFASFKVFRMETMQEMYTLNTGKLLGYDFSFDGKTLATATYDTEAQFSLTLWDLESGQQLKTKAFGDRGLFYDSPTSLLFLDANSPIVIQQDIGHAVVDIDRDEMRILGSDVDALSPDGRKLVQFNASNGFVRNLPLGAKESKFFENDRPITAMAFSPDGETLAIGDSQGKILLLDTQTWQVRLTMEKVHVSDILRLMFSPDGNQLVSVSPGIIKFWNLPAEQ